MTYTAEITKTESDGLNLVVHLADVTRKNEAEWRDANPSIEIKMPLSNAKAFHLGRLVKVEITPANPMSTTPTTPQWAIEAAKEIVPMPCGWATTPRIKEPSLAQRSRTAEKRHQVATIIAKHAPSAPPISPPTDGAKLRDVIEKAAKDMMDEIRSVTESHGVLFSSSAEKITTDRLWAALAPHLSQREPGDSELLDWLEKTEHDVVFECGDPAVGAFSSWQVWRNAKWQDGRPLMVALSTSLRAAIAAAMRREGKP